MDSATLVNKNTHLPVRAPERRSGPRLAVLDGLRLVAALMVVSFHYIGLGEAWHRPLPHGFPLPVFWASEYGFLGVELFFLISGFVICMSSLGRGLGDFFIARVCRLYPAYWFAVLATTVVVTALPHVRKPLDLKDTITNLSMLQLPLHVGDVDGVYWTLWAELRFYLIFAIVVAMGVTYKRVVAFCALWTVAAVAATAAGGALLQEIFMPAQAPFFIAGVAFFLIHRYGQNAMLWGIIGLQFILGVHFLGVDIRIKNKFGHVPAWFAIVLIAVFFTVMALIALGKLNFGWRWLTFAGTLTYPLYLLHQHIGWALMDKLQYHASPPVVVAVVLPLMLMLAWLVNRFVERPLARLMRGVLRSAVGPNARPAHGLDAHGLNAHGLDARGSLSGNLTDPADNGSRVRQRAAGPASQLDSFVRPHAHTPVRASDIPSAMSPAPSPASPAVMTRDSMAEPASTYDRAAETNASA